MVGRRAMLGLAAAMATGAVAQVAPPGAILQRSPAVNPDRINEEQRRRLEDRVAPDASSRTRPSVEAAAPVPEAAPAAAEVRFTLRKLTIGPSAYLPQAELDALARPLIGREVALGELQAVVDAINRRYAARGLTTARAILPAQQIDAGEVTIRLVEGRVGEVSVEGGSTHGRGYAARRAAPRAGTLATPSAIERALRLFNLNNDARLSARLAPGTATGTTDVILAVAEPAALSADVFLDNNGFESTGTVELGAILRGYRLFSDADRASLALVASRGVRSGWANVSAPLGERLRLGASLAYGRTRVLFGPVAELGVTGTSLAWGGDLATLLIATDRTTLTATVGVQTSRSRTSIAGRDVIANDALSATAGLIGNYAASGFAAVVQHQVTYARVTERLSDTTGAPVLFQGSALLAKSLTPRLSARLRGDWQAATRRNLPGVIQYQIGGARSSRAFAPGVAAGDSGLSASGELAYTARLDELAIEPFALIDHARASFPGLASSATSLGAGLNLTMPAGIAVRATIATDIARDGPIAGGTRAYLSTTFHF